MAKRGRPMGHKLSEESKQKISVTKTGQMHEQQTRVKISESLKKYFKTPAGIAQREKTSLFLSGFWNSQGGIEFRNSLSQSMRQYYSDHFEDQ